MKVLYLFAAAVALLVGLLDNRLHVWQRFGFCLVGLSVICYLIGKVAEIERPEEEEREIFWASW